MATVVNQTPSTAEQSGLGTLLALIFFLIAFVLLVSYGVPALRSANRAPSVNVPDTIDVNVNGNPGGQP